MQSKIVALSLDVEHSWGRFPTIWMIQAGDVYGRRGMRNYVRLVIDLTCVGLSVFLALFIRDNFIL